MKAIEWTDKLVERICDEIASGKSLRDVAAQKWSPSEPSIYRRMASDEAFAEQISKARAAQQDREVEECVRMADEATTEDWQVVKLRIWARQWRAAKLAPRRYGDKTTTELTGPGGGAIQHSLAVRFVGGEGSAAKVSQNSAPETASARFASAGHEG